MSKQPIFTQDQLRLRALNYLRLQLLGPIGQNGNREKLEQAIRELESPEAAKFDKLLTKLKN